MSERRYTAVLTPDAEVGGYTVTVPALPGCVTEGDTLDDAIANAQDAIQVWIEDAVASGEDLPTSDGPVGSHVLISVTVAA